MNGATKSVVFVGSSLNDLRAFPSEARHVAGEELRRVQRGEMPRDFKPMPSVGTGAYEIRVRVKGAWRVIYVTKFESRIFVLHAFQKKSNKTAKSDLELAARRYKAIGVTHA